MVSSLIHLGLALVIIIVLWQRARPKVVDFEVMDLARVAPQPIRLAEKPKVTPKLAQRAVFGASRKALTSEQRGTEVIKLGNTLTKAPDQEKLKDTDVDKLPIPTDEYLVSQMPTLTSDYRVPYPPEARLAGVQGAVIMDLLIDSVGEVREVRLIEGPGYGLNEAAQVAARKLRFGPARVQNQAVPVRIRYAYRFVLEK